MAQLLVEPRSLAESLPAITRKQITPLLWLNLVCLDAPIVAVTWQWFFAHSFHVSLGIASRAALFFTAWLIYLTDRLADAWILRANSPRSLRQEFCQRRPRAWIAAIVCIGLIDFWVVSRRLDQATIHVGTLVGVASLVYLSVNYWLGKVWRFLPIKEICIGWLFAFGTIAALFSKIDVLPAFIAAFFLFATLCSLNCIGIAIWERDLDRAQHKNSIATHWNGIRSYYRPVALLLALFAFAIAWWAKVPARLNVCIGLSAALLAALDWLGQTVPPDERTGLADLVLLTPLILLALRIA